ncbi:hypothetical protein PO124_04415 [Bacillus licheniformis]|nr:hypothetical protein [Bacillus licheniformis]
MKSWLAESLSYIKANRPNTFTKNSSTRLRKCE